MDLVPSGWWLAHQTPLRLGAFGVILGAVALWEARRPWRRAIDPRRVRWPGHVGLLVISTAFVRLVLPGGAVAAALWADSRSFGVLHHVAVPDWLGFVLAMIGLDLAIYGQHVLFHKMGFLWRWHRVHHSDREMDVSTALRFHPMEMLASMGLKMAAVAVLGAPVLAVLGFEVLLNGSAMVSHANAGLPTELDRVVRWLVVTPDMHRIHHSTDRDETDSNFGFFLSWWDRLFGSYRGQAEAGREGVEIGLMEARETRLGLWQLMSLPFRRAR